MGGGDLNLKKSWHPQTLRNVERVWKAEQKADAENKKIEQLRRELLEEKAREEMQRHAIDQGISKKKSERLDWMYSAPGQVDREEYLLGKVIDKHVDPLAKADEQQDSIPGASFASDSNVNSANDLAAKVRDDPLFLIKKKEDEKKKELLNNPVKMKQLRQMLQANLEKSKKKKEKKKKRKEKKEKLRRKERSTSNDSSSPEEELRQKSRRGASEPSNGHHNHSVHHGKHNSSERRRHHDQRRRSRSRSQSPLKSKDRHRKRTSDLLKRKRSRSRSPVHETERHERRRDGHSSPAATRRKSRSPAQNGVSYGRSSQRVSTSPSPPLRKQRSRSPVQRRPPSHSPVRRARRSPSPKRERRHRGSAVTKKMDPEELERRRQEMLANAQWRDEQRTANVSQYKEEQKREAEEESRNSGKSAEFISSMKVQSFSSKSTASVSDRIKRNINSLQRTAHALDTFLVKK